MMRCFIYESSSHDPWRNLAMEEYLLGLAEDAVILYLWQNENTVVIGKNQNPWKECRTSLLESEGGKLARRLSGGGAVFHDLGNLNFTFLMPQELFDDTRQFSVILEALKEFGLRAAFTGRNDLVLDGKKFSGSAYYKNGKQAYHHGTLLVDVDKDKLSRYLSPSKAKLQSKGVDSVRSRVVNLRELAPGITIDALKAALKGSFVRLYGPAETLDVSDPPKVDDLARRYGSWEWIYGPKLPFTVSCEERFPWGSVQVQLQVQNGVIREAKLYSDAMDWSFAPTLEERLRGCRIDPDAIRSQLSCSVPHGDEICRMICQTCL